MIKRLLVFVFCCYVITADAVDRSILIYGDSLSAGYGISIRRSWVSLLQQKLDEQGYSYRVVNASISGDTTKGAHARLEKLLSEVHPDIAIIELGGNDGLRGLSLDEMYSNLSAIIQQLLQNDTRVLLIPMQLPPNYGQVYNTRFQQVYEKLATTHEVILGRFILEDIAGNPELMQPDGIHPKAAAQSMMLDNIWPDLETLLVK